MKPRTKRALWIVGGLAGLGIAAMLVLNAFQSNLVFFFTPTQVAANEAPRDRAFRVGGLVDARDLDHALELAKACPGAKWATVEVRPVVDFSAPDAVPVGEGEAVTSA